MVAETHPACDEGVVVPPETALPQYLAVGAERDEEQREYGQEPDDARQAWAEIYIMAVGGAGIHNSRGMERLRRIKYRDWEVGRQDCEAGEERRRRLIQVRFRITATNI